MSASKTYEGYGYVDHAGIVERFEVHYTVNYSVSGAYLPQTYESPAEYPSIDIETKPEVVHIIDFECEPPTELSKDKELYKEISQKFLDQITEDKMIKDIEEYLNEDYDEYLDGPIEDYEDIVI